MVDRAASRFADDRRQRLRFAGRCGVAVELAEGFSSHQAAVVLLSSLLSIA